MADFFRIVKCHRLYLFLLLLILGFVYIIRDDYVVKDAFREQGEEADLLSLCVSVSHGGLSSADAAEYGGNNPS